jgi:HlyD family secretion protein
MALNDQNGNSTAQEEAVKPQTAPEVFLPAKKRRKRWPFILITAVVVAAVILILPRFLGIQKNTVVSGPYTTHTAALDDITVTLNGSGTLQPADSYTITSLLSGEILSAPFEEGDIVEKDAVLYHVDSSDVEGSVEQSQNALEQAQDAYSQALKQLEDLKLKAGGAGMVTAMNVKAGDTVTAGQSVATVSSTDVLTLKILFQRDIAKSFKIGVKANVYSRLSTEIFEGVVTEVGTVDIIPYDNVIAREVTIEVKNPGTFTEAQTVYVNVAGESGIQGGTLNYKYKAEIIAPFGGEVQTVAVALGDRVTKDQIVVVLQSDTLEDQVKRASNALEDAKLALNSQLNKVGEYTITSPISGTIVQKDMKAGDNLKSGSVLCTVFDLSHLTLVLNVDELDIKKVQPGQSVSITADASPDRVYHGVVTKININGTTLNGVTSYPITIKIEETEGLLPGMNVDATIIVEELKNVLTVPVGAVVRNNLVLVQSPDAPAQPAEAGIPQGFIYKEVTLGPSNDDSIVITGGLAEGDVVAVLDTTPSSYDINLLTGAQTEEQAENGADEPPPPDSQNGDPQAAAGEEQ